MEVDLAAAGIAFRSEARFPLEYKARVLGTFIADMVVEDGLLLEFKAMETLPIAAEIQVVQYLKAARLDVGLILNFGTAPLQIKRKYRRRAEAGSELHLHEV
jgi:GxxExxY protein